MRKRIVDAAHADADSQSFVGWRDLEHIATIEATSEHPRFPIESVFISDGGRGWRAAEGGHQQIRIIFDEPVSVRRIQLRFDEAEAERTQEFTLRCSSADGQSREIIRQRWNFSPAGSTMESEDYAVDFANVSVLELNIEPDVNRRDAIATLSAWRVAFDTQHAPQENAPCSRCAMLQLHRHRAVVAGRLKEKLLVRDIRQSSVSGRLM
jgi:hypothetical protein